MARSLVDIFGGSRFGGRPAGGGSKKNRA